MRRHDHFHEVFCRAVARITRNDHLVDLFGIEVADRAFDQVAFFVDLCWRCRLQRQFADLFPQALQVFVVSLDLSLRALRARRANDQACTIWHIHLGRDFFELFAVDSIGDLAADTTPSRRVRHKNTVTASERQIGRQRRAFVATLFFYNLDQQDLANLDHFLNFVTFGARFTSRTHVFVVVFIRYGLDVVISIVLVFVVSVVLDGFFGHHFRSLVRSFLNSLFGFCSLFDNRSLSSRVIFRLFDRRFRDGFHRAQALLVVVLTQIDGLHSLGFCINVLCRDQIVRLGRSRFRPRPTAAVDLLGLIFVFVLGSEAFRICALFGDQGFTVSDRDLIIIRMDFRERKETVPITTVIDKSRLKRRFDARYFCEIDITSKLAF